MIVLARCWRPHRVGSALRRYHRVGRRLYTAPGACSPPPSLTPFHPLSLSLVHSLSADDKGAAVQRATKHRDATYTRTDIYTNTYTLTSSTRLHAQSLPEQEQGVATREFAPSGASTHPLRICSV